MELEELRRIVARLQKEGLSLAEIITDRHLQIQKWVREQLPGTKHSFDVWHIAKGKMSAMPIYVIIIYKLLSLHLNNKER